MKEWSCKDDCTKYDDCEDIECEIITRHIVDASVFMCLNPMYGNNKTFEPEGFLPLPRDIRSEIYKIRIPEFNKSSSKSSNPGYCSTFTPELKASIRRRDNETCYLCKDLQHHTTFHVHHIDYDKKNSCEENLITLCPPCHMQTNKDREYWQALFEKDMYQ